MLMMKEPMALNPLNTMKLQLEFSVVLFESLGHEFPFPLVYMMLS